MFRELAAPTLIALLLLPLVLVSGQLVHVGDLLMLAGGDGLHRWWTAAGYGLLAMSEVSLPLVGLIACGLGYGRARADGALMAREALGQSARRRFLPALLLGLACSAGAAALAPNAAPAAIARIRQVVIEAGTEAITLPGRDVAFGHGGRVRTLADGELWAVFRPTPNQAATVLRARDPQVLAADGGLLLRARDAWLWGPYARAKVGELRLRFDDSSLAVPAGMLGPPNSTPSSALGPSAHHQFTRHRRLALPALGVVLALLGALLGGSLGGLLALVASAALVAGSYSLLRVGELAARAGEWSPAVAAWAPVVAVACLLAIAYPFLVGRISPPR